MDDLETPPPQADATELQAEETAPEAEAEAAPPEPAAGHPAVSMEELLSANEPVAAESLEDTQIKAVIEAIVYVAEEPLTLAQLAAALQQPAERIRTLVDQLVAEFDKPEHGITIREVAGGFKMATKAEHHDAVRAFVKSLKPPLKLSLPALETLAVIAYKQPVTSPEIMEIRGVQGAGVLKTLLDRKLIAGAGRKNVIGKPILYKTTKEFLIQFGLKDLSELPSLKEFEEIRRMALTDDESRDQGSGVRDQAAEAPAQEEGTEARAGGQGSGVGDQAAETPAQEEAISPPATEAENTPTDTESASAAEEPVSLTPDPRPLIPDPEPLTPRPDPSSEAENPSPDAETAPKEP
jgi:segregation and condensation protein B